MQDSRRPINGSFECLCKFPLPTPIGSYLALFKSIPDGLAGVNRRVLVSKRYGELIEANNAASGNIFQTPIKVNLL